MSLTSNAFSENLARSVAFLEELHHLALACAHYTASVATNIHLCFIGNKGKNILPFKKRHSCSSTSHLWEPTAHVHSAHQLFLSHKTTGLKALALNPRHSPYDWVPFATLVRKKAQEPHLLCQTTALWKATQTRNKLYQQKRRGLKNICNHMPNAEREEVTLRFLSEMSVWTQAC